MYLVLNATQGVPDFGPVAFEGVYLSLSVSVGQTEDLKISIMRNYLIYIYLFRRCIRPWWWS